jgi:hypothetical protein
LPLPIIGTTLLAVVLSVVWHSFAATFFIFCFRFCKFDFLAIPVAVLVIRFEPLGHQRKDRLHAGGLVLLVALDETHPFFFDLSGLTNAKRGNIDTLD